MADRGKYQKPKVQYVDTFGKLPPQVVEVEQLVLGACLVDANGMADAIEILKSEDFYRDEHQNIYQASIDLYKQGSPVDLRTVTNQLRKEGKLEVVGGAHYIAQLTSSVTSAANIEYHARIIAEYSMKRRMIQAASKIHQLAYEDSQDAIELIDIVQSEIDLIIGRYFKGKFRTSKEILSDTIINVINRQESTGITGIPSGFDKLDKKTGGWQNSDLITIAARPGVGKTAIVVSMLVNAAVEFKKPVAIFSLEMSSLQLGQRMISMSTDIELEKIRFHVLNQWEQELVMQKTRAIVEAPIFIDDTPALNILELRARCRRLKADKGIQLIIVDYLQLMRGDSQGNREQEISSISRALKAIAKELDIPVIALSQLSRAVESRGGDKRPMLSDIRESGSIEQDSDLVIFLYRPEYYGLKVDSEGKSTQGVMELIIAKHRNGSVGNVVVKFLGRYTKVVEWQDVQEETVKSNGSMFAPKAAPTHSPAEPRTEDEEMPF